MKQLFESLHGSLFLLIVSVSIAPGQNLVTGRVFEAGNGKYIKDAVIEVGRDFKTTSNALGFFQIPFQDSTQLQISCDGYIPMTVKITDAKNFKVELQKRVFIQQPPVTQGPNFPGGLQAFLKYIDKNISMPPGAPQGTILVQLYLDAEGMVIKDSAKIVQGLCKQCDREALKVIKKSPKWEPGANHERIIMPIVVR